jgi:hypothetical protein
VPGWPLFSRLHHSKHVFTGDTHTNTRGVRQEHPPHASTYAAQPQGDGVPLSRGMETHTTAQPQRCSPSQSNGGDAQGHGELVGLEVLDEGERGLRWWGGVMGARAGSK